MTPPDHEPTLDAQIDQWRSYLRRRQAAHAVDVAELEDQLRKQTAGLTAAGLAPDEAFLVALKRLGRRDALSREFAREHSARLWEPPVAATPEPRAAPAAARRDALVAWGLAAAAAAAIKAPALFGQYLDTNPSFYARNASLLVLPLVTGYFAWKRKLAPRTLAWLAGAFVAAGLAANGSPFVKHGAIEALTAVHLPIVLLLAVGVAHAGGRWNQVAGRMDFIRFAGEWFIHYVLIALGGGVLAALMAGIFRAIGIRLDHFLGMWFVPCGATGAVLVAAWLVEAEQSVIGSLAPVLTRLFTPLFAVLLLAFLAALLWTGHGIDLKREVLIVFDLLLVVVLGLLLYSLPARDPQSPPGAFDVMQVVLVVAVLLADLVALGAIAARISEFGSSPNRVAALGENLVLLVNLAWSAVLYTRFLRGRGPFADLVRWQTNYLTVYAAWAAWVVVGFPPIFGSR